MRFGNTLKIDYFDDRDPPGLGRYWANISQNAPFRGPHVSGNPLVVFEYTLNLDGTLGDRRVDAIFAIEPFFGPGGWARLFRENDFSELDNFYIHPIAQTPLTIHVVPGVGTLGVLAIGASVLRRRQR